MMNTPPPIPSPDTEPAVTRPVTGRVEWDEDDQCLLLVYRSSKPRTRLRMEWFVSLRNPYGMFGLVCGFPFVLLVLLYANFAGKFRLNEFRVFEWGVRDTCVDISGEIRWKDCKRLYFNKGDIYLRRTYFFQPTLGLPRETFADLQESERLANALRALIAGNGEKWPEVKAGYKKY